MRFLPLGLLPLPLLLMAIPPAVAEFMPPPSEAGWQPWVLQNSSDAYAFENGFSNGDALHISGWLLACTEAAEAANTEAIYWSRIDTVLMQIGSGYAEQGCAINGEFIPSGLFHAVTPSASEGTTCLMVNADIGGGLVLREQPSLTGDRVRVLPNGTRVYVDSLIFAVQGDGEGRQWLRIDHPLFGWASATAHPGDHINLQRCPS